MYDPSRSEYTNRHGVFSCQCHYGKMKVSKANMYLNAAGGKVYLQNAHIYINYHCGEEVFTNAG